MGSSHLYFPRRSIISQCCQLKLLFSWSIMIDEGHIRCYSVLSMPTGVCKCQVLEFLSPTKIQSWIHIFNSASFQASPCPKNDLLFSGFCPDLPRKPTVGRLPQTLLHRIWLPFFHCYLQKRQEVRNMNSLPLSVTKFMFAYNIFAFYSPVTLHLPLSCSQIECIVIKTSLFCTSLSMYILHNL